MPTPTPGDRVELISTTDPYTSLRPGDRGTVERIETLPPAQTGGPPEHQIWIDWDLGSTLALLDGVDRFRVLDDVDPEDGDDGQHVERGRSV